MRTRTPVKMIARCEQPDCTFVRIYWEHDSKVPLEQRVDRALYAHTQKKHPQALDSLRMQKAMAHQ